MVTPGYIYKSKTWRPSLTKSDNNNFFHSTFGTRTSPSEEYFDKHALFRRKNYEAFLTYFQNANIPGHLAEPLKDRFSESGANPHEFTQNLTQYISDITHQPITIKDLPMLASLENIKVVVFSDTTNSPLVVLPKDEIIRSYPNGPARPKEEVVLLQQEGVFFRMDHEPVIQQSIHQPQLNQMESDVTEYPKGGSAGIKGIEYQIALLVIFLLNAVLTTKKFKLSTENKKAGKLDDVVIEWPNNAILLQSKFKENEKYCITMKQLLSIDADQSDFSLPKYFLFHQKYKANFNVTSLILCTNAGVDKQIQKYLKRQNVCSKSMLDSGGIQHTFYTFNEKFLPILEKATVKYYNQNCQGIGIEESVITDDNLKDFLRHLQFYCNYPSTKDTEKVIETLLRRNKLRGKVSPLEITAKVMEWFKQKEGIYLTDLHAKATFAEIWRDRFYQTLESFNVLFHNNDWKLPNFKQISHVVTEAGYYLHALKIYDALRNNMKKILFLSPDDCIDVQKEIVKAFEKLHYTVLVIIWSNIPEETDVICRQFKGFLKKKKYKNVILVAGENILSTQSELGPDDYVVFTEFVSFHELEEGTKTRLLTQKSIVFQGDRISLNELFAPEADLTEALNLETLENLVEKKEMKVGRRTHLDEHINKYYIDRNLKGGKNEASEAFSQDAIYGLEEKLVLIRSCSGMGKTTLLAKLAVDLKEKHPHLWIIKKEVKDYAGILKKFATEQTEIKATEFFLGHGDPTKLNHLEKCVFGIDGKVVALLDSVDEVDSKLMTDLLSQCQNSKNFAKVFVTAKSHTSPEFGGNLKLRSLVLQPFTESDQVEFVAKYLVCKMNLEEEECKQSAKALVRQISWTNAENGRRDHFAAIPSYATIVAEHFQQWNDLKARRGSAGYLNGDTETESDSIYSFLTTLIKALIEQTEKDYVNRLDPTGNPVANKTFTEKFEEYLDCHRSIALEVILGKEKCCLFSSYRQYTQETQRCALNLGILQQSKGEFRFVCEKLRDYFFASKVIDEFRRNKEGRVIRKFFDEEFSVKPEFKGTLGFFKCLRRDEDISELTDQIATI